ncbi:hypothetical protein BDB01DRAFT_837980 [Pilobolus umbonatus]|nr:hypothetical protein BDB01DRAFT_837980 [Pilobolus umbonatus]
MRLYLSLLTITLYSTAILAIVNKDHDILQKRDQLLEGVSIRAMANEQLMMDMIPNNAIEPEEHADLKIDTEYKIMKRENEDTNMEKPPAQLVETVNQGGHDTHSDMPSHHSRSSSRMSASTGTMTGTITNTIQGTTLSNTSTLQRPASSTSTIRVTYAFIVLGMLLLF